VDRTRLRLGQMAPDKDRTIIRGKPQPVARLLLALSTVGLSEIVLDAVRMRRELREAKGRLAEMVIADDVTGPTLGAYYYHHPTAGYTFYDSGFGYTRSSSTNPPRVSIPGVGLVSTPTAIAQVALDQFGVDLLGQSSHPKGGIPTWLGLAHLLASLAANRITPDKEPFIAWEFEWLNPSFPASGPHWISALTTGVSMSVLLRAFQHTYREEWLRLATAALNGLQIPISAGGLRNSFGQGDVFEEVPTDPPTAILNGHIFALFGLHDYWRVLRDEVSSRLFERGVAAVIGRLDNYSSGYWSRYSELNTRLAPPFYQRLHAIQLRALGKITGESLLTETGLRWQAQAESAYSRLRYFCGRELNRVQGRIPRGASAVWCWGL